MASRSKWRLFKIFLRRCHDITGFRNRTVFPSGRPPCQPSIARIRSLKDIHDAGGLNPLEFEVARTLILSYRIQIISSEFNQNTRKRRAAEKFM
jgi:hypothetical protein